MTFLGGGCGGGVWESFLRGLEGNDVVIVNFAKKRLYLTSFGNHGINLVDVNCDFDRLSSIRNLMVAHDFKPIYLATGIQLNKIFDLKVAESALVLGDITCSSTDFTRKWFCLNRHSLSELCQRYNVPKPVYNNDLSDLVVDQGSFARSVFNVYIAQREFVDKTGLVNYLSNIEFPYTLANAWVQLNGIPISRSALIKHRKLLCSKVESLKGDLLAVGIKNLRDQFHVSQVLEPISCDLANGYLSEGVSWSELKRYRTIPVVDLLISYFKTSAKMSQWSSPILAKDQSRSFPIHVQNGTDTGRNNCYNPSATSWSGEEKKLVQSNNQLIEFDYDEIQPAIAGVLSNDENLKGLYLCVYDHLLTRLPVLKTRQRAKKFFLRILFGQTTKKLAELLNLDQLVVANLKQDVWDSFPQLHAYFEQVTQQAIRDRKIEIAYGLTRKFPHGMGSKNLGRKACGSVIQGREAIILKQALVGIHQRCFGTDVKVILTNHDSILVECPKEQSTEAKEVIRAIMIAAGETHLGGFKLGVTACSLGEV